MLTNTFGGSLLKLRDYGLEGRANELNEAAAELALSVKPAGRFVLASMGPCGKFMEPFGEITRDQMTLSFAAQAKSLAGSGIDGFMLETSKHRESMCNFVCNKHKKSRKSLIHSLI